VCPTMSAATAATTSAVSAAITASCSQRTTAAWRSSRLARQGELVPLGLLLVVSARRLECQSVEAFGGIGTPRAASGDVAMDELLDGAQLVQQRRRLARRQVGRRPMAGRDRDPGTRGRRHVSATPAGGR
jgi:hypothetical protein